MKNIVLFTLLVLVIPCSGFAIAEDTVAENLKREADRLAITEVFKGMVQAFVQRDAAAMAAHWIHGGEFVRNNGEPLRGRTQIRNGYAEFFRTLKGHPRLETQLNALRFPSPNIAVAVETLRLKNEQGEYVASSWQQSVLVRHAGQWKVAIIRAWDRGIDVDMDLMELEPLIGTWQANANDREVTITYEWAENKAFIRGEVTVKEGGSVVESGTQMIGKDNSQNVIRWWLFQSDGGFVRGVWTREGKRWTADVHGVRADGRKLAATTIYVQVDPNTFTWQTINQTLDGVPIADSPPIKVTKQNSGE